MDAAIRLDPKYNGGRYTVNPTEGIVLAGMIYFPWLYSDDHLNTIGDDAWRASTRAFGEAWAKGWDANALLLRYDASRNFDPSVPFGGDLAKALGRMAARALIMPSATDRALPAYMARELQRGIRNARYVEIQSPLGHLACCPASDRTAEYAFIARQIADFLSEP